MPYNYQVHENNLNISFKDIINYGYKIMFKANKGGQD